MPPKVKKTKKFSVRQLFAIFAFTGSLFMFLAGFISTSAATQYFSVGTGISFAGLGTILFLQKNASGIKKPTQRDRLLSKEEPADPMPSNLPTNTNGRNPESPYGNFEFPILAGFFIFFGIIAFPVGILLAIAGMTSESWQSDKEQNIIGGISLVFMSIIFFGVAQLIFLIAKIEFNTRRRS